MLREDIDRRLKEVIINNMRIGVSADEINDGSDLINDFLFDSVQMIRLISDIEWEFDIVFESKYMVIEMFSRYEALRDYLLSTLEKGMD